MSDFIIVGADTDTGKTTFAELWLSRFASEYNYWKPLETGTSDSALIRELVPGVVVHPPVMQFAPPVAPLLAARREGRVIPSAADLAAARPTTGRSLVIETFGGSFSPLNDEELQVDLIRRLGDHVILVGPSTVGAVGRMLTQVRALRGAGILPIAIVLLGPADPFAEVEIRRRGGVAVVGLRTPGDGLGGSDAWTSEVIRASAQAQAGALDELRTLLSAKDSSLAQHQDWVAADAQCVWHPYTSLQGADSPLPVVGAEAEFLHLADGRRVIDGISSWWTIQHGHRHPPLMRALSEASERIDHVLFAGATHPWGALLAAELLKTTPWTGGRVFFSDNGSTAVEVALKMAYQHWCLRGEPKRTTFIGFEHGYHGDTFGAMAIGRDPLFFGPFEPLLFRAEILPLDANRLDEYLAKHSSGVAGVIVEPLVQAAGGMRFHSEQTLRDLFDAARHHDVLFLVDEVMTGGGRLGSYWAHQAGGIQPDLIAAAKTLAGGILPLAATLASPRIVAAFDTPDRRKTFFHGHSFTAHPLACAVALANVPLVRAAIPNAAARLETFWNDTLLDLQGNEGVRDVRIRGSLAAVELDLPGGYLASASRDLRASALDRGVFLRPLGNVVYTLPPWCISTTSLQAIADVLRMAAGVRTA